jgi:hypothetical protein
MCLCGAVSPNMKRVLLLVMAMALTSNVLRADDGEIVSSPWMFNEAKLPAGFPKPGPVDEIIIKQYPACRAAVTSGQESDNSMFMVLFNHIKANHIAMSSPVVMGYSEDKNPDKMAFLYGDTATGKTGQQGNVTVQDVSPTTVVSICIRGGYSVGNYESGLSKLQEWLKNQSRFKQSGSPRVLAYNSPFVPWFMKIAEVQIPVTVNP